MTLSKIGNFFENLGTVVDSYIVDHASFGLGICAGVAGACLLLMAGGN